MKAIPIIAGLHLLAAVVFGQGGQVTGKIVDLIGDPIPKASIGLIPAGGTSVITQTVSDGTGAFAIVNLQEGVYTLKLAALGFRSRTERGIAVRAGAATNLNSLALGIPSCDAPGVNCDIFSDNLNDFPPKPLSAGYLQMRVGCEADLISNTVWCSGDTFPAHRARDKDLKVLRYGGHLYLRGQNGAKLSQPNLATRDCQSPVFEPGPIQMDDLDRSSDICVLTRQKYISHIFSLTM